MKQNRKPHLRGAVLRLSITNKKFGVRARPVRWTAMARAPAKEIR